MLKRLYTSCPARQRERLSLFHSEDPMEIGSVMRAFLDQVTLQPATKSVRGSFGRRLTGGESAPIIALQITIMKKASLVVCPYPQLSMYRGSGSTEDPQPFCAETRN